MPNRTEETPGLDIFKDRMLKERLPGFIAEVEAGRENIIEFFVKNITGGVLANLKFDFQDKETELLEAPKGMEVDEVSKLVLRITPPADADKGKQLNVNITGKIIYKP